MLSNEEADKAVKAAAQIRGPHTEKGQTGEYLAPNCYLQDKAPSPGSKRMGPRLEDGTAG